MPPTSRNLLIAALLLLSLVPVVLLTPYYAPLYTRLSTYHLEGLGVLWLGSYVLANLCTPGFMQSAGSRQEYEQSSPKAIILLYLSVVGILFGALAVVSLCLWCLGWLLILLELIYAWAFSGILRLLNHIATGLRR